MDEKKGCCRNTCNLCTFFFSRKLVYLSLLLLIQRSQPSTKKSTTPYNIYHFFTSHSIPYLNYLAPAKMASLRQSPLQFYPNTRHCCSSGTVYQEEAPIGSRALSSNQASFVNAPPNEPAAFTSSSINSATAIAHQPSKFSTVCLAQLANKDPP